VRRGFLSEEGFQMDKIKFLIKRMFQMNFNSMFEKINLINKKTGKNKIYLFFDMLVCAIKYQSGYMDYYIFEMYAVPRKNRKTYLTRGMNNRFIKRLNDKSYMHIFGNKDEFYERYKEFMGREYIGLSRAPKEEAIAWIPKYEVLIGKPKSGSCGKGIVKVNVKDYETAEKLYDYFIENNIDLVEKCIVQHDAINNLHPISVNTIRIVSVLREGVPTILCAYFRIGNGKFVDNFNSGGMVVPVEVETGLVKYKAIDKAGNIYAKHPLTGVDIIGFKIPLWEECKAMVLKASVITPQMGIVGWDVAVTKDGPVLIEGNGFPGHDIYQLPVHTPDKIGMLPVFEAGINGVKSNKNGKNS